VEDYHQVAALPCAPDQRIAVGRRDSRRIASSPRGNQALRTAAAFAAATFDKHRRRAFSRVDRFEEKGLTRKIGISVYNPEQIESVLQKYSVDLVQAPFNVVDRRPQTSGSLAKLKGRGIEVHTRSAFLQGLLAMPPNQRPPRFVRWKPLWDKWDKWLSYSGLTPIQACIGFVLAQRDIDRVVVGVDSTRQLDEVIAAASTGAIDPPIELASEDLDLIDPSRWN
jgi:aryl-alcohol dehydrogenase-like predicted oxidoreductase